MDNSKRLTVKNRVNGKPFYYSMFRKDELVARLGLFEDIFDTPDELMAALQACDDIMFDIGVLAIRSSVVGADEKLKALLSEYNQIFHRAKAPKPPSEPPSAI